MCGPQVTEVHQFGSATISNHCHDEYMIGERLKGLRLPFRSILLRFRDSGLSEETEEEIQSQQSFESIAKVLITLSPKKVKKVLGTVEERCSQNFLPRVNNFDCTKHLGVESLNVVVSIL